MFGKATLCSGGQGLAAPCTHRTQHNGLHVPWCTPLPLAAARNMRFESVPNGRQQHPTLRGSHQKRQICDKIVPPSKKETIDKSPPTSLRRLVQPKHGPSPSVLTAGGKSRVEESWQPCRCEKAHGTASKSSPSQSGQLRGTRRARKAHGPVAALTGLHLPSPPSTILSFCLPSIFCLFLACVSAHRRGPHWFAAATIAGGEAQRERRVL